jgi:hypothetical protein
MKNIQIIEGAINCVYDIFAVTNEEFALIYPDGTNIAFIDEVMSRNDDAVIDEAFQRIWFRPVKKSEAMGIHGLLFYELEEKKQHYPTRRDEEAINPDGTRLR